MATTTAVEIFHDKNFAENLVAGALGKEIEREHERVALIHMPAFIADEVALARAYNATNHIGGPWDKPPAIADREIEVEGTDHRSTAVGDLIVIHPVMGPARKYLIGETGWTLLDEQMETA